MEKIQKFVKFPCNINKTPAKGLKWSEVAETPSNINDFPYVGIKTGKINKITIVDIDQLKETEKDNVKCGMKTFNQLLREHNNSTSLRTLTVVTKNNGKHLYFKYEKDIPQNTKFNGTSIDTRNDGGYACFSSPGNNDYTLKKYTKIMRMPVWLKDWLMMNKNQTTTKEQKQPKEKKEVKEKTEKKEQQQVDNEFTKMIFFYETSILKKQLSKMPTSFYTSRDTWFKFTMAMKHEYIRTGNEEIKNIWADVCKVGKYTSDFHINKNVELWDKTEPKNISMFYVKCALEQNYLGMYQKNKSVIYVSQDIQTFTYKPDIEVDSKYINLEDVDTTSYDALIVKSTTGTGKTVSSANLIKKLLKSKDSKIISITSKVTLSKRQMKAFADADIDMAHYQETKDINSENNLVVQIDSLIRLNMDLFKDAIIYLDELNSMLNYLVSSSTMNKRRIIVFNAFVNLLQNARMVIATDADISDMSIDFIKSVGLNVCVYKNNYKIKPIKAINYHSKEKLINVIKKQLKSGVQQGYICMDSKKDQEVVYNRLMKFIDDHNLDQTLLIYNRDKGDKNDVIDCKKWTGWVITSPVITYGCDWNTPEKIPVFFIGRGRSIAAPEMFQMMNRVRNMQQLHYAINDTKSQLTVFNTDQVKEYIEDIIKKFVTTEKGKKNNILKEDLEAYEILTNTHNIDGYNNIWHVKNNLFTNLFLQNEYHDKVYRSYPAYHIKQILSERNFDIIVDDEKVKNDTKEIKEVKDKAAQKKEELMQRIFDTDGLTTDEKKVYNDIMKRLDIVKMNKEDFYNYRSILEDDNKFQYFLNFTKLIKNDAWINEKKENQVFEDYRENRIKSVLSKINMIKYVLDCLGLSIINIDTREDYKKFGSYVDVDTSKIELLIKQFNVRAKKETKEEYMKGSYKDLYYFVINALKGIVGTDMFDNEKKRFKNGNRYQCYNTNKDQLGKFMNLYKNMDRFFDNVEEKVKEVFKPSEDRMKYNDMDFDDDECFDIQFDQHTTITFEKNEQKPKQEPEVQPEQKQEPEPTPKPVKQLQSSMDMLNDVLTNFNNKQTDKNYSLMFKEIGKWSLKKFRTDNKIYL